MSVYKFNNLVQSKKKFSGDANLVYDLGMNNGDDSEYYLKLGFNVVALDANPQLCKNASKRFHVDIASGRIVIVNAAIAEYEGKVNFWINKCNDHWSSVDPNWAFRESCNCEKIRVRCLRLVDLIQKYGTPSHLKIDVEGADFMVLRQLNDLVELPLFISVEDCRFGYDYIDTLSLYGYNRFKLVDQSIISGSIDARVNHIFPLGCSGLLGSDLPGNWLTKQEIIHLYSNTVRDRDGNRLAPRTQWWDIHGTKF